MFGCPAMDKKLELHNSLCNVDASKTIVYLSSGSKMLYNVKFINHYEFDIVFARLNTVFFISKISVNILKYVI